MGQSIRAQGHDVLPIRRLGARNIEGLQVIGFYCVSMGIVLDSTWIGTGA